MSPRPTLVDDREYPDTDTAYSHGSGPPAIIPAPALGYSITANLGGNTQIVVQCFAGEDEPDKVVNGKIDRVMRVIDRQRAKYEIVELREALETHERAVERARDNLRILDADTDKALAQFDVQILETQKGKEGVRQTWYNSQVNTGRSGSAKPGGSTKSTLDAHDNAIKSYQEQKERLAAERDKGHLEFDTNLPRFETETARLKAKIAEKEALLDGA